MPLTGSVSALNYPETGKGGEERLAVVEVVFVLGESGVQARLP